MFPDLNKNILNNFLCVLNRSYNPANYAIQGVRIVIVEIAKGLLVLFLKQKNQCFFRKVV